MLRRAALLPVLVALTLPLAARAEEETTAEEMGRWVQELASEDYETRQAATAALLEAGPSAAATLFLGLHSTDPEVCERSRFILQRILSDLQPPEDRVRAHVRDALDRLTSKGSFGTGDPEYMEIVNTGRTAIKALVEILAENEQNHVKRIYAGAALAQVCAKQDVPTLIEYLSDSNVHVRIHVGSSMNQLTGERYDYDSSAGPENWSKAKEKYVAWWDENAETVLGEARRLEDEAEGEEQRKGPSTRTGG